MKTEHTHHINEDKFGRSIAGYLDDAPLNATQLHKLSRARMAALAHAREPAHVGVFAGVGYWLERHPVQRSWMLGGFAILLGLMVTLYIQGTVEDEEDDLHLLADELPMEAYLGDHVDQVTKGQ
ncbi:DUF3619 family protein [Burkholderiaceae bacterium DAT-1]|nr:DUF3619 family protein [Burkholderiaceae bacterium DAT-1]